MQDVNPKAPLHFRRSAGRGEQAAPAGADAAIVTASTMLTITLSAFAWLLAPRGAP